ncbi:MAG TPA: M28 family peptidase [Candidatus Thalassarchaeaceae archaeon]|nr:MAG TPA: M28 family peptidase [Candidatus Poseidoniales archaeon]HIH84269.1 M28 family peptidase [Candidatus Thalassarchaeaceae archaeon]
MSRIVSSILFCFLMLSAPLAGCFGSQEGGLPSSEDLQISGQLVGGDWSVVTLSASIDLSVYIPYFVVDPGSLRAQNGTVLDLNAGDSQDVRWLLPPRNSVAMLLIGEYTRTDWPVRAANESWLDWSLDASNGGSITTIPNEDNGTWNWLGAHDSDGGPVTVVQFETVRPQRTDLTMDDGVDASAGWVDGRSVYEWVDFITDETPDPLDPADGAVGYLDRWIGNGNPAYEDAITYFEGVLTGFGLRTEVHRFQSGTLWAANICGYKDGTTYPDEWLVFGGHFDIAPYATPTSLIPGLEETGYGTRTGAYDNSAGSAMVLTTAGALADFDARRTMVFCLWSSEEEGLWGSSAFADDLPSGVTVSNYLNLDMAGVNYPGNYALSVYLGPDGTGDTIDQPGMFHLAEWIGADALDLGYQMERGSAEWASGGESPLWQQEYTDTVAIYESPTARSDHDSFQQIGVATLGWNGVVDGFPCYHKTCDKLPTLEEYMETDNATGVANLAHSWDIVTWWAVYSFLHMDQTPVPNELE